MSALSRVSLQLFHQPFDISIMPAQRNSDIAVCCFFLFSIAFPSLDPHLILLLYALILPNSTVLCPTITIRSWKRTVTSARIHLSSYRSLRRTLAGVLSPQVSAGCRFSLIWLVSSCDLLWWVWVDYLLLMVGILVFCPSACWTRKPVICETPSFRT